MGAMLAEPSSFRVEINATGVPKYRMVGSMVWCKEQVCRDGAMPSIRFLRLNFEIWS